ncbi:hypothetical protein [Tunturiibacter gelidiferens]
MTTFSIANDVAKYFAIIPAMFRFGAPFLGIKLIDLFITALHLA